MAKEELIQTNPENQKMIEQIQKLLRVKLEQLTEISRYMRGYIVNQTGAVVALGLSGSKIYHQDLHTLAKSLFPLTDLTTLDLSFNYLTNISFLKELPKLTQLNLSRTNLTDIPGLKELPNLTQLYLHSNQLADISILNELPNLTQLDLSDNELTDVSALRSLTNLTKLYLGDNKLTDISALTTLTSLKMLMLNNNNLTDISGLTILTSLTSLDLSSNQISQAPRKLFECDWPVLWDIMIGIKGVLNLYGNPLESPPVEIVKQGREAILLWYSVFDA